MLQRMARREVMSGIAKTTTHDVMDTIGAFGKVTWIRRLKDGEEVLATRGIGELHDNSWRPVIGRRVIPCIYGQRARNHHVLRYCLLLRGHTA